MNSVLSNMFKKKKMYSVGNSSNIFAPMAWSKKEKNVKKKTGGISMLIYLKKDNRS